MITDVIKSHWRPPASQMSNSRLYQNRDRSVVGHFYCSQNLNWAACGPRVGHSWLTAIYCVFACRATLFKSCSKYLFSYALSKCCFVKCITSSMFCWCLFHKLIATFWVLPTTFRAKSESWNEWRLTRVSTKGQPRIFKSKMMGQLQSTTNGRKSLKFLRLKTWNWTLFKDFISTPVKVIISARWIFKHISSVMLKRLETLVLGSQTSIAPRAKWGLISSKWLNEDLMRILFPAKNIVSLKANHFQPYPRSFKRNLFTRWPSTLKHRWIN